MEAWMFNAAVSVVAAVCVVRYFFFFFNDPVGFAGWCDTEGQIGFKRGIATLAAALSLLYYVAAALMQVFEWATTDPDDDGYLNIDTGMIVALAALAVVFLMQAMSVMAKQFRRLTRERDEAIARLKSVGTEKTDVT